MLTIRRYALSCATVSVLLTMTPFAIGAFGFLHRRSTVTDWVLAVFLLATLLAPYWLALTLMKSDTFEPAFMGRVSALAYGTDAPSARPTTAPQLKPRVFLMSLTSTNRWYSSVGDGAKS